MADYRQEYEKWLASPVVDEATREELKAIAGNEEELEARFGSKLAFGTAGLRGLMMAGTNAMNVYTVRHATQCLANVIIEQEWNGEKRVAIAHDSRNNSPLFSQEAARVLAANGIKVVIFDALRPTPELSFAVRYCNAIAGINITASHNPKEYNGYKAYWADGSQLDNDMVDAVSAWFDKTDIFEDVKLADYREMLGISMIKEIGESVDRQYLKNVMAQSVGEKYIKQVADGYKIVYTPFHGAGYKLVPELLEKLGFKNIIPVEEQMIPDGNFPTVKSPNPENTEGFALALEYAKKSGAELIIGTDPDSDRCGAAVKAGDDYVILTGNQMACLMLDYLITVRREQGNLPDDGYVVKSIVSTVMANKICEQNGVRMEEVLTGFRFIGAKIKERLEQGEGSFVFGFEESLGFLAGTYARDKDAVFAAMMMAELGCYYKAQGKSVYEGLQALYEKYGFYIEKTISKQFEGYDAQENMATTMKSIRENPPVEIGLKVTKIRDYQEGYDGLPKSNVLFYELEDGCAAVVRPSGTEPKIKCYVMAQGKDQTEAEQRKEAILSALDALFV